MRRIYEQFIQFSRCSFMLRDDSVFLSTYLEAGVLIVCGLAEDTARLVGYQFLILQLGDSLPDDEDWDWTYIGMATSSSDPPRHVFYRRSG